ncbi:MAG TPA: hypothetical protein VLG15_01500 [Thermoanaerobaculia bacterium]|nr:hypothetical protein [Thermoanaerobaculia bacterium]
MIPVALRRWWLVPLLVCVLRGLPFLLTQQPDPSPAEAWIPTGYIPKDFLAYVSFLRQVPDQHRVLFVNPFTTEPQEGRFFMLFLFLLGWISRVTGLDPFLTLELSRIPMLFLFFWLLARFVGRLFDDPARQRWAFLLVGLSGGIDILAKLARPWLPEGTSAVVSRDLWHVNGWTTFAAFYNPLWIAGLALSLSALAPLLDPARPADRRTVARLSIAVFLLHWVHVYSEIVVLAVAVVHPLVTWALGERVDRVRTRRLAMAVGAPLAVNTAITLWQLRDSVFASSSGQILGPQQLSVFWYPLTLALVGAFALRGIALLARESHPWRTALVAWIAAVVFLHSSPVVNGYHFVFHLHLPVALAAAPAVAATVSRFTETGRRVALALVLAGLFASPLAITWEAMRDVYRDSVVPRPYLDVARRLGREPPGNVLAPWQIGHLIPAYGPQRSFVGHWFMTPKYSARVRIYGELVGDPRRTGDLLTLVGRERIGYIVTPRSEEARLAAAFGERVSRTLTVDGLSVLVIGPEPPTSEDRSR